MQNFLLSLLVFVIPCSFSVLGQTTSDAALLEEIKKIKAVDNHAHPMSVPVEGKSDDEFDSIGCGKLQYVSPAPVRLRLDNTIYTGAWRELYRYSHSESMTKAHVQELLEAKKRVMKEQGVNYPSWVLDQLNIDIMLTNRVSIGSGLAAPRFRWVALVDPVMLPLSIKALGTQNSDRNYFFSQQKKMLRRELSALQLNDLPATLEMYLKRVVTPTLERQKREGAVGIKFVTAYMRSIDFADISKVEASRVYAKFARGGEPSWSEYKKLQDFLFRYIAQEAGRLGLVVHIHTGSGCGHYFSLSGSNPLLLESVLNDPSLRKTNFVLVHGGYPFIKETEFLLEKPNVYADFSAQTFLLSPRSLSAVLRAWLGYEPEKVLFGTDAHPASPEVGWEESVWLTNKTAREALALALTGMINDGEISRDRALELARMVMRENAIRLYGFGSK